jgi:hypothetical protein
MSLALLLGVLALMAGTTSHFYLRGRRPEPQDPIVPIEPHREYQIESVSARKCVQLTGGPGAEGGEAQIRTCDKSDAQRFQFDLLADGAYRIRRAGSNQCLAVADGSQDDGAAVSGVTWNGDRQQQWVILAVGEGAARLMVRHSDKAMDVWHEETADGTALKQMSWKGSANQQFRLSVVDLADR